VIQTSSSQKVRCIWLRHLTHASTFGMDASLLTAHAFTLAQSKSSIRTVISVRCCVHTPEQFQEAVQVVANRQGHPVGCGVWIEGGDLPGYYMDRNDSSGEPTQSKQECRELCQARPGCNAVTYISRNVQRCFPRGIWAV
jgi:hypothetical protein